MKNYELINYKKLIAFVVRNKIKTSKTKFFGTQKDPYNLDIL